MTRMIRALAAGAAAILTIGSAGLGWFIARRLTDPATQRRYDLVVRGVEVYGDRQIFVLDRTRQTEAVGIYSLMFAHGGWVQLDDEILDRGPDRIGRPVTRAAPGFFPRVGDRGSWSGIYFASTPKAGLAAQDVVIDTPVGGAPAWLVKGDHDCSTWAIHIHGLGSPRAGTLRGVQVASALGYTSLVISYRNDGEGPRTRLGRSGLGFLEVDDAEAALQYAINHGARRIVLFGWSMGAMIALQLADRARRRGTIVGLVLDSPVLDWQATTRANCARNGLPKVAAHLATPWLTIRPLSRVIGLPTSIPLHNSWIVRANQLVVPTLILHGSEDDSTPVNESEALRALRPDVVELETFNAGHTMLWNSDPERWRSTASTWLSAHIPSTED